MSFIEGSDNKKRGMMMKVKDIMTTNVISVDKDQDVKLVLKLMKKHGITKIPVLEEKKLIGVVNDEMLAVKLGAIRTRGIPAARMHATTVMDKELDIISQNDEVSTILSRVGEPGPTILHVVEDGQLIGIVTKANLLPLVKSKKSVDEVMKDVLRTVSPEDRVIRARHEMIEANIARLPVVNNGLLIGIIADFDIAIALAKVKKSFPLGKQKHQLDELLVNDAMRSPAVTIESGKTVKEAAELMIKTGVGCLPVVRNGKLLGIISRTDLLKLISL
jgi:CBS domain-containing protein